MSDHSKSAGCSNAHRDSEIRRPRDPNQLKRMRNWKDINSFSSPSIDRNAAANSDVHEQECARRGPSLLAQVWKSKETCIGKGQLSDQGASLVMPDALHSAEGMTRGGGALNITGEHRAEESVRALEDDRMMLSKTSICRMAGSCVDQKNVDLSPFLHSEMVSSERKQCAELNVNRETQSVVPSKRRYGCWDARLDSGQMQSTHSEFALGPSGVKSLPEEFQFQGKYMMRRSRLYRFPEKKRLASSGPFQNDSVVSTSGYELGRFSQTPDAGPSICAREENIHSVSGIEYKKKLANHRRLNLNNEICKPSKNSLLTISEKKRGERLIVGCSWPVPRDLPPKAHSDSPTDVSDSDLLLIKRSSMQGFMELNGSFCEQHFQQSVPGFSIHEVEALRRCTTIDSVDRALGISIKDENEEGQAVDAYAQNESHVRTCLEMDAHRVKSLPEGVISARSDKKDFTGMQNLQKSESTSALHKREGIISNHEIELLDKSLDITPCIATADSVDPIVLCTSGMDTVEVEHIISQAEMPEKYDSSRQPDNHAGTEVSNRWVKRLKLNSDSTAIGTRDYNTEDVLTTRRVDKLFSRVMNYSRSNSFTLAKCLQECQQFQKTMLLLKNNDSPVESFKESHPWIQRWCQKSQQTACAKTRKPTEVLCEPEKTKPLPENLEGKLFPSLAAMALMGKAFNNFRPCEFRRRGSSLVWHTEGF